MNSQSDLAAAAIAFSRALTMGDIDGAMAIYNGTDHKGLTVALGAMLGGILAGADEQMGGLADPWALMVDHAERLKP